MDGWKYALEAFLAPFFWAGILGTLLWLTRRIYPPAVDYLFGPISNVGYLIGKLAGRLVRAVRQASSSIRDRRQDGPAIYRPRSGRKTGS